MAKHCHIHTMINTHSKGTLLPIHKASKGGGSPPATGGGFFVLLWDAPFLWLLAQRSCPVWIFVQSVTFV